MEDWLADREPAELRCQVIEGCEQMTSLYLEVDQEWNNPADDVWSEISG